MQVFAYLGRIIDSLSTGVNLVGHILTISEFAPIQSEMKLFTESLDYIKQLRLENIFHWTPLFSKKKFHSHEYDIPLDGICHLQGPHVLTFLISACFFEL